MMNMMTGLNRVLARTAVILLVEVLVHGGKLDLTTYLYKKNRIRLFGNLKVKR